MIEQLIAPVTGLLDKFVEDKDQRLVSLTRYLRWRSVMLKS